MEPPTFDLTLLKGARFQCRPGCALCCFTTPAVTSEERGALLRILPDLPLADPSEGGGGGFARIASRDEGGACHLLERSRCRAHSGRPFPCRSFPLHTSLERRVQVSLVLSCPGVELAQLTAWSAQAGPVDPPVGLMEEIGAVERELQRADLSERASQVSRTWERALRTFRRREPQEDLDRLVEEMVEHPPLPTEEDFPAVPPPPAAEGLELLPLSFDEEWKIVAWSEADEGWELLKLREEGGPGEPIGTYPPPDRLPRMDHAGTALLRGYLSYVARRDRFLSQLLAEWLPQREYPLREIASGTLRQLGAEVLARGMVLSMLRGQGTEQLAEQAVELGIRATDMDHLDQSTLGEQL